jgi:hypothetical protein
MDFFTEDDIRLLYDYREAPYRDTKRDQGVKRQLATGVWTKTRYWAEQAAGNGFMAEGRVDVLRRAGTATTRDGERKMVRKFRPYSWMRLQRSADAAYQVFFTVGVDAERQEVVWKLDCKREGSDRLDRRQVARFEAYLAKYAPGAAWQSIQLSQLGQWSWERLKNVTQQFILDNTTVYEQAIQHTWAGHKPERDKLARVCWNSNGWQQPSGPDGKSSLSMAHEASEGWGAEEWLFNFDRLVDGYCYAYLRPLSGVDKHIGQRYNISLYTLDAAAEVKSYYYVGRLRDAEVLSLAQQTDAMDHYQNCGWLSAMEKEVRAATGRGDFHMDQNTGAFNVRFRPEQVERPSDGLELILDISEWTDSHHYVLLEDTRSLKKEKPLKEEEDDLDMSERSGPDLIRSGGSQRRIKPALVELPGMHQKVQTALTQDLRKKYPGHYIKHEVPIRHQNTFIDVVREQPDGQRIFYEVKVLSSLRACIREALGQLLEYAHWPSKRRAKELVIVSYYKVDKAATNYLIKLSEIYGLQLKYLQIQLKDVATAVD